MNESKSGLLSYLFLLTAFFFMVEISFTIQMSGFYLGDFKLVGEHLHIPLRVVPGIAFFIFAQLLVHAVFTLIIWAITRLVAIAVRCTWQQTQALGFSLWGLGLTVVLLANQIYFANSKFADLTREIFRWKLGEICFALFSIILSVFLVVALVGLVKMALERARFSLAILAFIAIGIAADSLQPHSPVITNAATVDKPNIFIIGVDALRPDFLSYFGNTRQTPHLDAFLNQATVFAEAVTPLARTFPAWASILTGQYPKISGARTDLADQSHLNLSDTLPAILQRHGYETVFAMDETRFSNINQQFGFDRVVTPPVGFNDFLLGTFNDFPLSNLVINTRMGEWLFPHSYANRPAFVTYDPNSFLKLLQPVIAESRDKPLFFAVHFCLPHFPYFWESYSYRSARKTEAYYQAAVIRADEQVAGFLALLKQNGLLEHSIVVLLSDHGEALELHGDRITDHERYIPGSDNKVPHFYPPSYHTEKVNQSAGHGTDVLGLTQYHSVLAFRLYGEAVVKPSVVPGVVSLMDIKPTILSLLGLPSPNVSGISLREVVLGKNAYAPMREDYFMESDFSPQSVRSVHPETRDVLFQGIDYFKIDPITTQLTVKQSMDELIISSKQYADLSGEWVLALYPQANGRMMPVIVNLETGSWTNDLRIPFAKHSPAQRMLSALKHFYGSEIRSVENA